MGAPQNYEIAWSNDNVTYTALSNVQSINASIGRQTLKDPFQPSRLTFSMRYPSGFTSPNTALVTGTWIRLRNASANRIMWRGKIADVSVDWGIPYDSGVGVSDFATITCEGAAAEWGRLRANDYAISASNAYYALASASAGAGLSLGTTYTAADSPLVSASVADSSWLDWINLFAQTLSSTVKDGSGQIGIYSKDYYGFLPVSFSDVANDSTHQRYEEIELTSQVENYFTQVLINTSAYGQISATYGSAPYRTLELSTISGSAAQATDLANYYLTLYQQPTLGISKITCRSEAQATWVLDMGGGYEWWDILGYRTKVIFRGSTYDMTILGSSMQASPSTSTITYYLIDSSLTPWFILDSTDYGILDTNRLSW